MFALFTKLHVWPCFCIQKSDVYLVEQASLKSYDLKGATVVTLKFRGFFLSLLSKHVIPNCDDCKKITTYWNQPCLLKLHTWYSAETFKCT